MKSIYVAILACVSLAMSQLALAHPGHDHSHWMSEFIHVATVLSIGAVIVAGVVYKQSLRRKSSKKGDMNHDA